MLLKVHHDTVVRTWSVGGDIYPSLHVCFFLPNCFRFPPTLEIFEYLMTVSMVKVARPSCGTQFLSRLLSSELISTSFKVRIDVFIAIVGGIVLFPAFGFDLFRIVQGSIVFVEFDIGIHLAWDNRIKYCLLNIPFAFGEPDFTFLDLEHLANW